LEQFDEFVVMNELQVDRMNISSEGRTTSAVSMRQLWRSKIGLREDVNMNLARIDNLDGTIAHHLDNYEFHAHDPESGRL